MARLEIRAVYAPPMQFDAALKNHFPGATPAWAFVARTQHRLAHQGFDRETTIACVGTCRDELCVPLRRTVQDAWGEAFNFSSLAGMLLLGTAGFRAAHAHAPIVGGRERYLYVAMPHIGIGSDGSIGTSRRIGRAGDSVLCGALNLICNELAQGPLDLSDDPDNPELALVRRKIAPHLVKGQPVSLIELTKLALRIIEDDLEHLIGLTVDTNSADYAVLTGIQIHGPSGTTYVKPSRAYTCVGGVKHDLVDTGPT